MQVKKRITDVLQLDDTGCIGTPGLPEVGPSYGIVDGEYVDYSDHLHITVGGAAGAMQLADGDS